MGGGAAGSRAGAEVAGAEGEAEAAVRIQAAYRGRWGRRAAGEAREDAELRREHDRFRHEQQARLTRLKKRMASIEELSSLPPRDFDAWESSRACRAAEVIQAAWRKSSVGNASGFSRPSEAILTREERTQRDRAARIIQREYRARDAYDSDDDVGTSGADDLASTWMRPLTDDARQRHSVTINRRITSDVQAGNIEEGRDAVAASVQRAQEAYRAYKERVQEVSGSQIKALQQQAALAYTQLIQEQPSLEEGGRFTSKTTLKLYRSRRRRALREHAQAIGTAEKEHNVWWLALDRSNRESEEGKLLGKQQAWEEEDRMRLLSLSRLQREVQQEFEDLKGLIHRPRTGPG